MGQEPRIQQAGHTDLPEQSALRQPAATPPCRAGRGHPSRNRQVPDLRALAQRQHEKRCVYGSVVCYPGCLASVSSVWVLRYGETPNTFIPLSTLSTHAVAPPRTTFMGSAVSTAALNHLHH